MLTETINKTIMDHWQYKATLQSSICHISVLDQVFCLAFVLQLRAARHQQEESPEDPRAAQDGGPRVQPHHGVRRHQRRGPGWGLRGANRLGPRQAGQQPAGWLEAGGWNWWVWERAGRLQIHCCYPTIANLLFIVYFYNLWSQLLIR